LGLAEQVFVGTGPGMGAPVMPRGGGGGGGGGGGREGSAAGPARQVRATRGPADETDRGSQRFSAHKADAGGASRFFVAGPEGQGGPADPISGR